MSLFLSSSHRLGVAKRSHGSRSCSMAPAVVAMRPLACARLPWRSGTLQQRISGWVLQAQAGSDDAIRADETKDLSSSSAFDYEEPDTAREAIDMGLVLCKQEKWDRALAVFQKALTLPGTGQKRYRDKPRLISDGEKMAALFNIACCHSRLGEAREGLLALSASLEAGYADFDQILTDPDLELLRQDPRFAQVVQRFQPKGGSFLGFKLPW